MGQSETRSCNKRISQVGSSSPSTWVIFCCFSQAISRGLDQKWSIQEMNKSPNDMLESQLAALSAIPQHWPPYNNSKTVLLICAETQGSKSIFFFFAEIVNNRCKASAQGSCLQEQCSSPHTSSSTHQMFPVVLGRLTVHGKDHTSLAHAVFHSETTRGKPTRKQSFQAF